MEPLQPAPLLNSSSGHERQSRPALGKIMLYLKALLIWLGFAVVAVALGTWRDMMLRPRIGDFRAHQVETLVVCAVFFAIIAWFVRWAQPSPVQALWIGAFWVVLTLLFEFGLGFALGRPLQTLLADYNLLRGRLWPLVLITELVGPWFARRVFGARLLP